MTQAEFYKGKRVLVTGHTGFKGSWLCKILSGFGATVTGYALSPNESQGLYDLLKLEKRITSVIGDICDYDHLKAVFDEFKPEIVFHMAAQPLVRESYKNPKLTYETNVLGTVNVCECIRLSDCVKSFVNITTDKVYKNNETGVPFKEDDMLDGYDPYSNSKSCSELVTHSYISSFFEEQGVAVSCVRAGNVIGGGDFSADRIIPDCVRAAMKGQDVNVRNPQSVRPYQHVLEPLQTYLCIAKAQYEDASYQGMYNVGPDGDCATTGRIVELFCSEWGEGMSYEYTPDNGPHEAGHLSLDCNKVRKTFGLETVWDIEMSVIKTTQWYKAYSNGADMEEFTQRQIEEFYG